MLTIKAFSRITAIPETTLRYYEEMGLLAPAGRAANGYRLYAAEQVMEAKYLYSLRLASIPLQEVKRYQEMDEEAKRVRLERWQLEISDRIERLTLARQYLDGLMRADSEPVHLQTSAAQQVLWFTHEAPVGGFSEAFAQWSAALTERGFVIDDVYFRWLANVGPGLVRGDVGFAIADMKMLPEVPRGGLWESRPAHLTLSTQHTGPIEAVPHTYERLFAFMKAHGWAAQGPAIERYPVKGGPSYTEILVPIMALKGRWNDD